MNKPKMGNIWWLASYPKSGNTWVRMFLLAYLTGEKVDINAVKQFVISDLQPDIHPKAKGIKEFVANYREAISKQENVCIKTHNANIAVDGVRIIPEEKTNGGIYIVRDPRDVAISFSNHYDISVDQAIKLMNDPTCVIASRFNHMGHVISSWSMNVKSWLETKMMAFRYEDLLRVPEQAFTMIIRNLYLPNHGEERLKFAIKEASFDNLCRLELENGFSERSGKCNFFRVGTAGQWKSILTEEQAKLIEEQHKEVMKGCKYL